MKKLLSTLLALTMLIVCAVPAFAASDGDARDTDFFTDQPHTDLNFGDIEYEHVDPAPLIAEAEALLELAADGANAAEFETRFLAFKDNVYHMYAMWELLSIMTAVDSKDEWAADEYAKVYDELNNMFTVFNSLVRDVLMLENECSEVLSSKLTPEDVEDYLAYEEPSQEEIDLENQDIALEAQYRIVDTTTYTTTIDGKEYDADSIYDAYMTDGEITLEQYLEGCHEVYGPYGDIYLQMIDVRNQIAKLNGYDNYADYGYAVIYNRDYTVEEIDAFRTAVKTYLVPQLKAYRNYRPGIDLSELPLEDSAYTGDGVFDTIAPYFGQLSDELLESMRYVQTHGSYDIDPAPNKTGTAYSMMIPYYNMPFYFSNAYGNAQDLLTTIHEMGHNNKSYWSPNDWTDVSPSSNKDTAEVHSQALELLMTHFYPELFGTQAEEFLAFETYSILSSITSGCLHDEIQCYAYSTPNVTFEMICQKYRQLAEEYGNVGADDPRPEMFGWTSVPHTFESPMYYISYATSAAGAFAFWEEAQHDFYKAVDHYLEFCAQPAALGFDESFAAVGIDSPLSPAYIERLAKTAHDKLFLLDPYTDVYTDDWFVFPVYFMQYYGIMTGTSETTFSPKITANREQAMTILARLFNLLAGESETYGLAEGVAWATENGISDGTNPSGTLTREQFAVMLYNFNNAYELELAETDDLSDFSDVDSVSDWALEAVQWAVGNGLLQGSDGKINPQGLLTRAELATFVQRFAYAI